MNMLYKYLAVISSFFIAKSKPKAVVDWEDVRPYQAKYGKCLTNKSNQQYLDRRSKFRNRYKQTVKQYESEIKEERHIRPSQFPHSRWLN